MKFKGPARHESAAERRLRQRRLAIDVLAVIVLIVCIALGLKLRPHRPPSSAAKPATLSELTDAQFAAPVLLDESTRYWKTVLAGFDARYEVPQLRVYGQTLSALCGASSPVAGPFYCPTEERIYLEQAFMDEMDTRAGEARELARRYVIGHEVGHHLQNLLGTTAVVEQARATSTPEVANRTLVVLELQADCYAGLWLQRTVQGGGPIAAARMSAALDAASAAGAARVRKLAGSAVLPDPFSHGTAEQRHRWFGRGLNGGTMNSCDTFSAQAAGQL
ncbi:MAG TPA: neutral zinc metallopeptidase [Steroidobacteraceae bacterium]